MRLAKGERWTQVWTLGQPTLAVVLTGDSQLRGELSWELVVINQKGNRITRKRQFVNVNLSFRIADNPRIVLRSRHASSDLLPRQEACASFGRG